MNLTRLAIEKRAVTYYMMALLALGGAASFFALGQLEDPEFTVKTAVVTTPYPGASPEEVELEVTDRIEKAVKELTQALDVYSVSSAGLSTVVVEVKEEYWSDRLPQVWDELRKKIRDKAGQLPPGAGTPVVSDDFGFVYGFVLAITGDGFNLAQLKDHAEDIRKELNLVDGVSRVELWGEQQEVVYLDINEKQLSELGISGRDVAATLQQQNVVVDAGNMDVQGERMRVAPTGAFRTPEEIGELAIVTTVTAQSAGTSHASDEIIRIRDIARVRRGYQEPPSWEMRYNGVPAIGIALANEEGGNIVDTGRNLDLRLGELLRDLPVGIDVHRVAWQSDEVTNSIDGFFVSLLQAVLIVLVVLTVPMGWRMGVVIGSGLVLTILGTFIFMAVFGIDLQRMSLGALVIALGMMVDNAIVVSDGIQVRLAQGVSRKQAAIDSTKATAWPLLGATIVAVLAFYPIYASVANAGEYCQTLFSVVAIALVLSWLLAMTITPVQCMLLLKVPKVRKSAEEQYGGRFYGGFRFLLRGAIRFRLLFLAGVVLLLVLAMRGFDKVDKTFFPDAMRSDFMVDYWAPEGTRIEKVSADLRGVEAHLLGHRMVEEVTSFIGAGPPRFYLPVDPEGQNSSYAQLLVKTHSYDEVLALIAEFEPWCRENLPEAMVRVRKFGVGPSDTWKFEARFSGPAEADLATLRRMGDEGVAILRRSPLAKEVRTDMRERVKTLVPRYAQERARRVHVAREDVATATRRAYDGLDVGLFREGDELLPILLRHVPEERSAAVSNLDELQVELSGAAGDGDTVPLSQVTDGTEVRWEDPFIVRYNRRRCVTVQCSPENTTFPALQQAVLADFQAILDDPEVPAGYELFWDGEAYSTAKAQEGLQPGIVPAVILIITLIVILFNAYRPPLIILLTVPFVLIGIVFGLLLFGQPFGFLALLGAMSLAGMMIKNAIVLLDQINANLAEGMSRYDAVIESAVSRLRPVVLAAATTVLGVIPLLPDIFWVAMAVTIMAGLTFGTLLTMFVVPAMYSAFYGVKVPEKTG